MMISLPFTKMPLERSADKRKSEHWIKQQSTSTSAKYVLHYRGKFAFCSQFNLITISAEKQQKSECLTKLDPQLDPNPQNPAANMNG